MKKLPLSPRLRGLSDRLPMLILAALAPFASAQNLPVPDPAAQPAAPTATTAPAQDETRKFNNARQVRVDVLMVSLPQAGALALLPDLRDPQKVEAAQARLLDMIGRKEAKLEDWPEVTTSGQRAVSENIVEFRYPIEFELPKRPEKPAPEAAAKPASDGAQPPPLDPGVPVPSMFESKNTGYTLEVEPVVSADGSAVSLSLAPQFVELERMLDYPAGKDAKGQVVTIAQPIFRTHKVQTNLTLRDGERRLIYVGKPLQADAPVRLFILGVKVLPGAK